ncbi:MAG: hypothetical protein ABI240_18000, partial [Sphingomonas sp.]
MVSVPSGHTSPERYSPARRDTGELISALESGDIPWLSLGWLASSGALPPNFAPSGRSDIEEAFHELFAATG